MTKKINDKDKLIIALYVNGYGYSQHTLKELCCQISNHLIGSFDDTVKFIVLPINDEKKPRYEFECINGKQLNDTEYSEFIEKIKKSVNCDK